MIIATRNRAHTLKLVAPSFFKQECVREIIFVNDSSDDDTVQLLQTISKEYPAISCKIVSNTQRMGQGQSRNIGLSHASMPYILFCDDDEYMEDGYAKICLDKFQRYNAGAVAGRRIYMRKAETCSDALQRFGNGLRHIPPYYKTICEYANCAIFEGDIEVPLINAIMLTSREMLDKFPFDSHYFHGNGYREESDFHMNLYVNGYKNYTISACHTFHLPLEQVKTGGQRVNLLKRIYWSNRYNAYFFDKYYDRYKEKIGISVPKSMAKMCFFVFTIYKELLRPPLRDTYLAARALLRPAGNLGKEVTLMKEHW